MQNPLTNFIGVFSLVRDVRGFQVNPLCRHDITVYVIRNLDVIDYYYFNLFLSFRLYYVYVLCSNFK